MTRRAQQWEDCYVSAVFAGIIGDANHTAGYHLSIEDNPSTNYSVVLPDDKAPPGDWPRNQASGTDMSMSTADMKTDYARMLVVYHDRSDPRRKYVRGYNGWDGVGSAKRLDFAKNTIGTSSSDHKWHGHREDFRRYVNDPEATRAIVSIHKGETKEQFMGGSSMTMLCTFGDVDPAGDPEEGRVAALQARLWFLGYDTGNPPTDGNYGPKTRDALKAACASVGWTCTGEAFWAGEWAALGKAEILHWAAAAGHTHPDDDGGTGAGPHKHDTAAVGVSVTVPAQEVTITIPSFTATGTAAAGETSGPEPV